MKIEEYLEKCNQIIHNHSNNPIKGWEVLSEVPEELIALYATQLNLVYVAQKKEGNLCFVANAALRPEFRTVFTTSDIVAHLVAYHHFHSAINPKTFWVTKDEAQFWEWVAIGEKILKESL